MIVEEKMFTEVGAVASYVQNLYNEGAVSVVVTPMQNRSWYLFQIKPAEVLPETEAEESKEG